MTTCLVKSCKVGLLCMPFVSDYQFVLCFLFVCVCVCACASSPFGFEGGMWDLIVLIPDYCLSFYFIYFVKRQMDDLQY